MLFYTKRRRRLHRIPITYKRFLSFIAVILLASPLLRAETLIERAYNDMYNLQFEDAHRDLAKYESLHPNDPLGPVADAAAYLFSELDRMHILQSEFLVNDSKIAKGSSVAPDPTARAHFQQDLLKAKDLAVPQLASANDRANAMLAETLRLGLDADYLALIDKRQVAALTEVKAASNLAKKLLASYPSYYDGYIAVGMENYLLSQKPAPVRWLLHLGGAGTDKEVGLNKLRLTAEHGHYLLPYARLLLALAALRDGDRKTASQLLTWLSEHYPRNTLYKQELAKLQASEATAADRGSE